MWRRVEIRNFRSIEEVQVDLAPFTVIVGKNGAGKSNFIDALVFARDVTRDASAAIQSRGGIAAVRRWRPKGATEVTIDVRVANSKVELETAYARHRFVIRNGKEGDWAFKSELVEARRPAAPLLRAERTGNSVTTGVQQQDVMARTLDARASVLNHPILADPRSLRRFIGCTATA